MKLFIASLIFLNFSNIALAVGPDTKVTCKISNGWTINTDYYWDGHPQGPGGWSGVSQINDWGKFIVTVNEIPNWKTMGHTTGQTRLENIQVEYSLDEKKEGYIKLKTTDVMGKIHHEQHTLKCE
ncbi:MAG: hypothetical protein V4596_13940 [Bdellovibrionota bacterium]